MSCEEFELPCRDALLGATLALMSAYSLPEPHCGVPDAARRVLIARKVLSNLFFLRAHPSLPPGLRQLVHSLHGHWERIAAVAVPAAAADAAADAAGDAAAPSIEARAEHGRALH